MAYQIETRTQQITLCTCDQCGHSWQSDKPPNSIKRCAKCTTTAWNRPKYSKPALNSAPPASHPNSRLSPSDLIPNSIDVVFQQDSSRPLHSAGQSSQFSDAKTTESLHAPSFVNATVARKMGHESGCSCVHCERIRSVLSTSKPPQRIGTRKR
jgi:hypothetical protein